VPFARRGPGLGGAGVGWSSRASAANAAHHDAASAASIPAGTVMQDALDHVSTQLLSPGQAGEEVRVTAVPEAAYPTAALR